SAGLAHRADGAAGPGWYPDPFGRHELRYYDAQNWTDHVASQGHQAIDPPSTGGRVPTVRRSTDKVLRDVAWGGGPSGRPGGGSVFTEPILVVNQKAKLIEVNNEYAIFNQAGTQIGAVRQVGQSTLKKMVRLVSSWDQFMTHKLEVVDMAGTPLLSLTRPAKVMRSKIVVDDGAGRPVGQIVQENVFGKINFGLHDAGGRRVGAIKGQNWLAWNFSIDDAGVEVGRITTTWEGLVKTEFTTADNFVVRIHRELDEPLRSLVVASALGVDTALKQDSRGFG
ncbi:MAG TPA: phospholipid scramblase-related protein, partial [Acidimicrobiales bacterium]|nr:phospholipid scramblase-related protein [Acidimicrobiales bacterium]